MIIVKCNVGYTVEKYNVKCQSKRGTQREQRICSVNQTGVDA